MILKKWDELPENFKTDEVRRYYDILNRKKLSLVIKRVFDIVVSTVLILILFPIFIILAIAIKIESRGSIFYRQERVTRYGKHFKIFKFRTMVQNADKIGAQLTTDNDSRITRVGKLIRKCRLDEISQLIDVLRGTMTFVGTRPEVPKFVDHYNEEMIATLLLPAGVTSLASIYYKNEDKIIGDSKNLDDIYIERVLPDKMFYNLKGLEQFSLWGDIKVLFMTVFAILGKEYKITKIEEREYEVVNKV